MHSGRVCLVAPDRLENEWDTFRGSEKADTKKFFLERKKKPRPPQGERS
jgi:hypothetical protein